MNIKEITIHKMGFSVKTYNTLNRAKIKTIGEIFERVGVVEHDRETLKKYLRTINLIQMLFSLKTIFIILARA